MSWKFVFRGIPSEIGYTQADKDSLNKIAYEGGYRFICHGNFVFFLYRSYEGDLEALETPILKSDLF